MPIVPNAPIEATQPSALRRRPGPALAWSVLACVAIGLPWLNPFAFGPTPVVVQHLLSGTCAVVLVQGYLWLGRGLPWPALQRSVALAWLVTAGVSSVMALVQYFGWVAHFSPWINYTEAGEAFANLRQRNQFASLMSLGLVAWLYLQPRHAWLRWGSLALLAAANAASASRTGAVQWVVLTLLAVWWAARLGRATWRMALGALVVYAVAVWAMPVLLGVVSLTRKVGVVDRFLEGPSCESRLLLWSNVLELIAQKPWTGWGWGGLKFAHFIHPYTGPRFCDMLDNAHNLPLHLAVELGLPATVALVAGCVGLMWRGRPWRETDPARQMAWAALVAIGLHSTVEYPLWYGPFQMAVAACLCLLLARRSHAKGGRSTSTALWPTVLQTTTLCVVLMFLAYAAWDYKRVSQIYVPRDERDALYRDDPISKVQNTRLFRNEVQFADLITAHRSAGTALHYYALALELSHFSPEPRVLAALLANARLVPIENETTALYRRQFQAVYPEDYAASGVAADAK